jgi:hypothetical protein
LHFILNSSIIFITYPRKKSKFLLLLSIESHNTTNYLARYYRKWNEQMQLKDVILNKNWNYEIGCFWNVVITLYSLLQIMKSLKMNIIKERNWKQNL